MIPMTRFPRTFHVREYVSSLALKTAHDPNEVRRLVLRRVAEQLAHTVAEAMTVEAKLDINSDHYVYQADLIVLTPQELMDYVAREAARYAQRAPVAQYVS